MKLLKKISLVYVLQVFAVLILFFYPNYPSKAGLKGTYMNTAVAKSKEPLAGAEKISSLNTAKGSALINSLNLFWLTGNKKITPGTGSSNAGDFNERLKKEYGVDALSLDKISNMSFKPGDKKY